MTDFFSRGLPPYFGCEGGGGTRDRISEQINVLSQETGVDSRAPIPKLDIPGGAPILELDVPGGVPSGAPVPELNVPNGDPSGDTHVDVHGGETPVDNPFSETQVVNSEQTSGNIPDADIRVDDSQQTSDNATRQRTVTAGARNSALKGFFESCWGNSHRAGETHGPPSETPVGDPSSETQVVASGQTHVNIRDWEIRVYDSRQSSDNASHEQTAIADTNRQQTALPGTGLGGAVRGSVGHGDVENPNRDQAAADDAVRC